MWSWPRVPEPGSRHSSAGDGEVVAVAGKVLIVGGGEVGAYLASLIATEGRPVTMVEVRPDRVTDLVRRLGLDVVEGSGTDAVVLERAGIRECDVAAMVTGADEANLVASSLARFEFGVDRVIARVVDPRNAWMYTGDMGVDAALNPADLLAHLVAEEMSLGEMTTLLKLRRGQFSLVEERVEKGAAAVGRRMAELALPDRCVLVAVIRGADLLTPRPELVIEPGDEVMAVVPTDEAARLAELLGA